MNTFDFKQFSIIQERSAMKVGTDGVLLGAWAECGVSGVQVSGSRLRMLDIGTGTGLIALMLAQRYPNAVIDAIEIDHDAAEEAKVNAVRSRWADRINVFESSLNDFLPPCLSLYDLIAVNPPFYNATLKPDNDARAAARHADSLPFRDVTRFADRFLSDNGRLAVIYPTNNEENVMLGVASSSLSILKICDIFTKAVPNQTTFSHQKQKNCKRRMLLLRRKKSEGGVVKETLCLRSADGDYSPEYRALTADFYLHLKSSSL